MPELDPVLALSAAVGAALLLITRTVEPSKVYERVDWGLLVFFVGLFIIVAGAERAGLTKSLLQPGIFRIRIRAGWRWQWPRRSPGT
jgi:Na+/H+ antiporter NhaD/arsenite permease-like protein